MREALYFRNISFSVKLDSEADYQNMVISGRYEYMAGFCPGPDMISGATLPDITARYFVYLISYDH